MLDARQPLRSVDVCIYSAPQQGSKSQAGAKPQKGRQPAQAQGKPDFEQAGALADWLKDAAAEMKKQGVSQKFTVSSPLSVAQPLSFCEFTNAASALPELTYIPCLATATFIPDAASFSLDTASFSHEACIKICPSTLQDSFLGDLVNEISMQNAATEATHAQAQATNASSLKVSKDQFIRLTADFDNFRRRTVRLPHYKAAAYARISLTI